MLFDVVGSVLVMSNKNMVIVKRIVMFRLIFFLDLGGRKNLISVSVEIKV